MKTIVPQAVFVLALLTLSFRCPAAEQENVPRSSPDSPASPKAVPGTDKFRFGPVTEVLLSSDVDGKEYLLNLDTGRVLTPAQEMRPERLVNPALGNPTRESCERIGHAYLYGLGVDIIKEEHLLGLAGCDLVIDPLGDERKWDSLSAGELVLAAEQLWRSPLPLYRNTFGPKDNKVTPPHTFLFRTREGRHGILQITEMQRQPKKVRIRYKLVEVSGQSAPSPESGVQNPSGQ